MDALLADLRYGLRLLRKSPVFAVITIGTLALGIGATTAMFSVVDGVLLKPFPVKDQARLLVVWTSKPQRGFSHWPALFLSVVGTYGTLSFFVRQRRHEIGIRMALGAAPSNVRRLVLRQGVAMGALGVLLGTAFALAIGGLVQPLLFGVTATDPLVLSGTAASLLAAVLAATLLPTRLAAHTDPLRVLRSE
jgi:hypothetical protein